jgi:hypothetical protein
VTSHPQTWTGSPAFVGALSEEELTFIQDVHDPAVIAQLTHTPRSALDRHRQPGHHLLHRGGTAAGLADALMP